MKAPSKRRSASREQGPRPVGIWVRVSTDDQAQGESPEHHEKRARHYVEAKGWCVLEQYDLIKLVGRSAKLEQTTNHCFPADRIPQRQFLQLITSRASAGRVLTDERPPRKEVSWFCRMLSPRSLRRDHGRDRPAHPSNRENLLLLVAAGAFQPI